MNYHCTLCGKRFGSYNTEAFHRHNAPALCKRSDRLKFKGITPTMEKVLLQAIADGGVVDLNGPDRHAGWNQRHITASMKLQVHEYGRIESIDPIRGWIQFKINEDGRKVVA